MATLATPPGWSIRIHNLMLLLPLSLGVTAVVLSLIAFVNGFGVDRSVLERADVLPVHIYTVDVSRLPGGSRRRFTRCGNTGRHGAWPGDLWA